MILILILVYFNFLSFWLTIVSQILIGYILSDAFYYFNGEALSNFIGLNKNVLRASLRAFFYCGLFSHSAEPKD